MGILAVGFFVNSEKSKKKIRFNKGIKVGSGAGNDTMDLVNCY